MVRHHAALGIAAALIGATLALVVPLATPAHAATFVVTDTRDRVDSRPGNGVCRTSSGSCTLRAALQEANARPGADSITLGAGTYRITRAPINENLADTGDLDISGPVAITGAGAGTTVVDGGTPPAGSPPERTALDRLFEIHPGAGDVSIAGLTMRDGWEQKEGGALAARSTGTVRLIDVAVRDSFAGATGGGIFFDGVDGGSLVIERSTIAGNATDGEGGGVYVTSGRLTVTGTAASASMISGNRARNGGGIYNAGAMSRTGQHGRVDLVSTVVSANTAVGSGGGIDNRLEGRLHLTDVTVSANEAGGDGGGVSGSSKSTLTATGTTFSGNLAAASGGGVFSHSEGPLVIEASTFSHNAAGGGLLVGTSDGGGDGGGGLAVYGGGSVAITDSTVSSNTASGEGGGMAIHSDGPVAVADTEVFSNASGASGGGILASGKVVALTGMTVVRNWAVAHGGGIDNQGSGEFAIVDTTVASNAAADGGGFSNRADSTLRVTGSTFSGNAAASVGGGFLHQSDAATEIENTTVSGNSAGLNGGGLYLDADAGLHVVNTTISMNTAGFGSGVGTADAIDNFPVVSHPLLVFRNTIVAGNSPGPDCHAAFGSEGGNLDGGTLCNFGGPRDRTNVDPDLNELADNGGPTLTHALRVTSPAVDGGMDPCPRHDQRGVARELSLPCDIGAYEFGVAPPETPPPPSETLPETTLDSGPSDTTEGAEATFAFSSSDPDATFECSLDSAEFTPCVSPLGYTELGSGRHTFEVRAVDAARNADATPASFAWTIEPPPDSTPPETMIVAGPPGTTDSTKAAFVFSADDPFASFECSLDGVSFVTCVSGIEYAGLGAGAHSFAVRATDLAGNEDPTPASHRWTVDPPEDTTAPATTLDAAPAVTTVDVDATFEFSADEPGSTFRCALDGPSFNLCVSPVELSGLSVGTHTFAVYATDLAGNAEVPQASHTWTIEAPRDTIPPETLLASAPASPTEATTALFTFSASETGSTFECALDVAAFDLCTSPVEHGDLATGDHAFSVRAIDPAGNVDPTPETYVWTIDEPPSPPAPLEVSIELGPDSPTRETTARFAFSATVPGAQFQCALDPVPFEPAAFEPCQSGVEYGGLGVGEHNFVLQAVDAAGNLDSVTFTWTIEAAPACGLQVAVVADADAWVDENSSSTNKGSDSILKVQSKAPRDDFRALVHFPLPDRPGCEVESAVLSVYAASSAPDRTLQAFRLDSGWSETEVTWDNQPATAGPAASTLSGTGYREWQVTSLVEDMYANDSNHGFLIRDAEGGEGFEQQFHSREKGEAPPMLVVTYAPIGTA